MTRRATARANQALAIATEGDPPDVPADIAAWLARLALLYGLPFDTLVLDWRLLPIESIRFFWLDATWVDAAVQGASSIGSTTTFDDLLDQRLAAPLDLAAILGRTTVRDQLRGVPTPLGDDPPTAIAGFLLRSAVVSGFPGLEVKAADAGGTPLKLLRMDRLSADTMLVLLAGVPAVVQLMEPPEGLHFGFHGTLAVPYVYLRGLGVGGYAAGVQIPGYQATAPLRTGGPAGVIDVAGLAAAITAAMPSGSIPEGTLAPSGFAVEVVSAAGLQPFLPPTEQP